METKLISLTQPIEPGMSPEEIIVFEARVSSSDQNNPNINGLLKYCIREGHWSIFEMVDMTVEIVTTRAIAAQILRHKSFCFQERSQRYAEAMDYEPCEARRQDSKNRQNSIDDLDPWIKENFLLAQKEIWDNAYDLYKQAIAAGIAKECARMLLPLNTATKLYMKGSVRSWIHYLQVRCDPSTQLEHRAIADSIKVIFCEQFPIISNALGWIEQ